MHTEFQDAMRSSSLICNDPIIADGKFHYFSNSGQGKKKCWYICHGEWGSFGEWPDLKIAWTINKTRALSSSERKQLHKQISEAKAAREKEVGERHESVSAKVTNLWHNLSETGSSPYLQKKQVGVYRIRFSGADIVIPVRDVAEKLWSLQTIRPDGTKRFYSGGRKNGCFHVIGDLKPDSHVYVCEGYATAATVHMATGQTAIVAFDAGNLAPVIAAIKSKYPSIKITIAADNDQWKEVNAGKDKAEAAAVKYGCEVVIPEFQDSVTHSKPTDFNDLQGLAGLDEVKRQLLNQSPQSAYILPGCFSVDDGGVYYIGDKNNPLKICSKLEITAYTQDEEGCNAGRILEWVNENTGQHYITAIPCRLLAGDGTELREILLDKGLIIGQDRKAREKLAEYILTTKPGRNVLCVSRIGWHGEVFVLPNKTYPGAKDITLQSNGEAFEAFGMSGTLKEWQKNVACYAAGNSRLIFALSIAFAAPLLKVSGEESGVFHFVGPSSTGKTSTLRIAGSVWGGGGENGFIKQWKSTANAQEAMAEQHRDCLLLLDELGQADSKTIGDTSYMLANNQGKRRMNSSAALKPTRQWRILVISSGEVTLETKMQEANKKALAGMEVRFINIPAEVEGRYGIFENLHAFKSGHELSRHLQEACRKYYGTAIDAFLEGIAGKTGTLIEIIRTVQNDFNTVNVKSHFSGQVKRVAERFGFIAAAGELAIDTGILPLKAGEAVKAASQCFNDWLKYRGSTDNLEIDKALTQIRSIIERYSASRFITIDECGNEITQYRPIECIGYRILQDGVYHHFIYPDAYNTDLCKGFNPRMVTKELVKRGYLVKGIDKNQELRTFRGEPKRRFYHISPTIFEGGN